MELTEDQKATVLGVLQWAERMGEKHGKTVIDKNNNRYDWGQALCREQFGTDWNNYMIQNNIALPTSEDFDRALEWEEGEKPDWVLEYK